MRVTHNKIACQGPIARLCAICRTHIYQAHVVSSGHSLKRSSPMDSYTLSVLYRNASLENASRKTPPSTATPSGSKQRPSSAGCGVTRSGIKCTILTRQEKLDEKIGRMGGDMIAITVR